MKVILYISDCIIPLIIFCIVAAGISMKLPIFDLFIKGAKEGFEVVKNILPTLIGLMMAVGLLRASGALLFLSDLIKPLTERINFPSELVPLSLVKMFSSSASTGLLLDIFKEHGTDSYLGRLASVLMSCSETIFYTMSVYFMTVGVKKSRYTLAGALVATLAGIVASVFLIGLMM